MKKTVIFLLSVLLAMSIVLVGCNDAETVQPDEGSQAVVDNTGTQTNNETNAGQTSNRTQNTQSGEQQTDNSGTNTQSDKDKENEQKTDEETFDPTVTKTEETLSSSLSKSIYLKSFETMKSSTNVRGTYNSTFWYNGIEDGKLIGLYTKTGENDDTVIYGEIGFPDGSYINIETIEKKNGGYVWTNRTQYVDTTEFETQEKQISYIEWLNALDNHNVLWFFYDDMRTEGIPDMLEMEQSDENIQGKKIMENGETTYVISLHYLEMDSDWLDESFLTIVIENEKIVSIDFQTTIRDEGNDVSQINGRLQIQYDFNANNGTENTKSDN